MFENNHIDKYNFEEIPINQRCSLMSEIYMQEFDEALVKMLNKEGGEPYKVGYMSYITIEAIHENSLEVLWYPTIHRSHEVSINIPREEFKICVGCWRYDVHPQIFVKKEWLELLYLRQHSMFALVDAIGVKDAIKNNTITKEKLLNLRDKIDALAENYKNIAFISFADSLVLKSNWVAGYHSKKIKCSYEPEIFLIVIKELENIYKDVLGLNVYAILTQGSDEYYEDSLLHISNNKNHICLNSLGVPFAELLAIDNSVRIALKNKIHPPMQVYIDKQFYHSLQFKIKYNKNEQPKNSYQTIMKSYQSYYYYYASCDVLIENFEKELTLTNYST